MTDEELHREIYNLGAGLLNGQWPVLRAGFDRHGFDMNKHRYKRPIPTTVVGQVLTMSTDAYDAFGLTVIGLGKHATAAALGPIRFILESLAWLCWLLEDPDGQERRARAYGLAMNSIDGLRRVGEMLSRVTSKSSDTVQFDTRLAASTDRMKRELLALAEEDGVTIAPIPGSLSKLVEQYYPIMVAT